MPVMKMVRVFESLGCESVVSACDSEQTVYFHQHARSVTNAFMLSTPRKQHLLRIRNCATLVLDDLSIAHRNNSIRPLQRIRAMRNENRRNVLKQLIQTAQHAPLCSRIECGSAFIENQDSRPLQQRPR